MQPSPSPRRAVGAAANIADGVIGVGRRDAAGGLDQELALGVVGVALWVFFGESFYKAANGGSISFFEGNIASP